MPRRKPLKLALGLRLRDPGSEQACRAALAALKEAEALKDLPLHWNLSLSPLAESRSWAAGELAGRIKARVKVRTDAVLPSGFRGVPHPLLLAEELDRELAWCRRNPWLPGLKSLLGQEPLDILPAFPDLLREQAVGAYSRRGYRSIGLALSPQAARRVFPKRGLYRFILAQPEGRAAVYCCLIAPSGAGPADLAAFSESLEADRQPLFLLLEIGAPPASAPSLPALLEALQERFELELLSLAGDALFGSGAAAPTQAPVFDPPSLLAVLDPFELNGPTLLEGAERAGALRSRRRKKSEAEVREILNVLAGAPRGASKDRERPRRSTEQVLIASMTGLVSLEGPRFAATFTDGRFSGLQRNGTQLLSGLPARSYLTIRGKPQPLQTESAFSFERDPENGLRTALKARLPGTDQDVRLSIEAFFRDGETELELDFVLSLPVFAPGTVLEQMAMSELVLWALDRGAQVRISAELGGGQTHTEILTAGSGERLLYGNRFLLAAGLADRQPAITLAAGPSGSDPLILPLRLEPLRGRVLLLANPFGSYQPVPAEPFSGRTARFSLRIGLAE